MILVVDDEPDIRELIRYNLDRDGFHVATAETGEEGLNSIKKSSPDLLLLDLMLPGMDGLEVCRRLRSEADTRSLPIIMISAKGEEADVVTGLELGADDYVVKPFSPRVLLARVKSVLRRQEHEPGDADPVLRFPGLEIHPGKHEVFVAGKKVDLTATEFRLLQVLAKRPGWVFTRYQIVDAVRGDNYPVTERSVDVQITGLRKKMGSSSFYIETVRGVGYRFHEPE